ncbi:uncharacterized protein LOC116852180 [Odontomachus brunneus]|uniref:uncharacterized protein LOC116852180 n=1 Tax=Odontomachus brunneus TaxID=486640 RepID=UPI0013F19316|nr:uncharacterized protein LOC116852180 [Odontomachus brunneus]
MSKYGSSILSAMFTSSEAAVMRAEKKNGSAETDSEMIRNVNKETWAQCIQLHASLLQLTPEANRDSVDYFKLKHFDLAANVVQSTLDFMAECLEELEPSVSLHQPTSIPGSRPVDHASASFSLSHLPPINLPQFSGKFEEWESFRDRFTALIVHNTELSAFARMHFLSSSLTGRALESIKTIPVTADNFDIAWETLKSRYDNKRRLVETHISKLFQLPSVSCESAADLNNLRDVANRSIASLKNLNHSDLLTPEPIDLLLGADLYGELLLDGVKKGGTGQPVAQNTIFGWILSGPSSRQSHLNSRIHVQHCASSLPLEKELRKFWEVEEIPRRPYLSPEEQRCEDHFDYSQFLRDYEDLGHMRLITKGELTEAQCVYIPHYPVLRESSSTTRLRVVFNASSSSSNSTSLNDHLLPGPKLQTDLSTVILKWRTYQYVLSADIAKMYRQILVNYQRILWSANNTFPVQEYQLLTVTYGTASAPFLALRVLQQLVKDEGHAFPLAVPILRDDIYVDDVLFGADDIPLLRQTRNQVRSLLRLGRFELRKWSSNTALLLQDIDSADHGLACNKSLKLDENLKILGISWNPSMDAFQFNVSLPDIIPHTKREILSAVARIFDPLGWGTPATVNAKIFLQKLWQSKLDWDDPLTEPFTTQWSAIYKSLTQLDGLTIPRWVGQGADTLVCELHGFSDASSSAYAAAVYLKVVSMSGHTTVSLLTGKSKVAPIKTWSIPRLELAAAVLLSRLLEFARDALHLKAAPCFCWTDSTIRHVSTRENPADCASRGCLGNDLVHHPLWWQGPTWLRLDPSMWPPPATMISTGLEENPRVAVHVETSAASWDLATRYSLWPKLIRITAYLLRFIAKLRRSVSKDAPIASESRALSFIECQTSRLFWLHRIQSEVFPLERQALEKQRSIPSKSPLCALSVFLDEDKLIHVGGRLKNAPLPFARKHPVVLAAHPVVELIVRHAHLRSLHAGPQLTLATVRQDYWVLRARSLVKFIIH